MANQLQAELKQASPFPRRSAEALLSILRTAADLDHLLAEALKPFGLTPTQYNVLRILRGAGANGLCGRDIGERMVSRVPDVSRLLERMGQMQVIDRKRDGSDRRQVAARITPKGVALLSRATPALERVERERVAGLSQASLQGLIDGLARIRQPR